MLRTHRLSPSHQLILDLDLIRKITMTLTLWRRAATSMPSLLFSFSSANSDVVLCEGWSIILMPFSDHGEEAAGQYQRRSRDEVQQVQQSNIK